MGSFVCGMGADENILDLDVSDFAKHCEYNKTTELYNLRW